MCLLCVVVCESYGQGFICMLGFSEMGAICLGYGFIYEFILSGT